MKTLELRDKPLFQATLGDLIEALNEGFANEGKDGRANTNPSSEKRYVYGLFGISSSLAVVKQQPKESNQVVSSMQLFLKTGRLL